MSSGGSTCAPIYEVDMATATPGTRALHRAARTGNIQDARLLLQRDGRYLNVADNDNCTPLMLSCISLNPRVDMVRLLLEAGADPAVGDEAGMVPLHVVALYGHIELVDMLYSKAPATLNYYSAKGQTPLYVACDVGNERMVSKLLSLEGMERTPTGVERKACPLTAAVTGGFAGVVRLLMTGRGLWIMGGESMIPNTLIFAVEHRQANVVRVLLTVSGRERRSQLANMDVNGTPILHYATSYCYPAAVGVLLHAGANEAALDPEGRRPRGVLGVAVRPINTEDAEAIVLMLLRGPAYRARSWAWPLHHMLDADRSGSRNADTTGPAEAAVVSSPPVLNIAPIPGVRIFQAKAKNGGNKLFGPLIGRYCAKH